MRTPAPPWVHAVRGYALGIWALGAPALFLLGEMPVYFIAYQLPPRDILVLTLVTALAPALLGLLTLGGLGRIAPRGAGVVAAGGAWLLGTQLASWGVGLSGAPGLVLGLVLGALLARYAAPMTRTRAGALLCLGSGALPVAYLVFLSASGALLRQSTMMALPLQPKRTPPVVLVLADELALGTVLTPEGELDAEHFPNLARLASTGTLYPEATANYPFTIPSMTSLYSGTLPDRSHGPVSPLHPNTILSLFAGEYRCHIADGFTQVPAQNLARGVYYQRPYDERLRGVMDDSWLLWPVLLSPWRGQRALFDLVDALSIVRGEVLKADGARVFQRGEVLEAALAHPWDPDEPLLLVVHVMLPHFPWRLLPDGTAYQTPKMARGLEARQIGDNKLLVWWPEDQAKRDQALQRHYFQAMALDTMIGKLWDRLATEGLWDDALVVMTSDHGIAFEGEMPRTLVPPEPGGPRSNFTEVLRVPLIVKYPGQREAVVDPRNAELVDLAPTIAEVMGVELPWTLAGQSLRAPAGAKGGGKTAFSDDFRRFDIPPGALHPPAAAAAFQRGRFVAGGADWLYRPRPHGALVGTAVVPATASPLRLALDPRDRQPGRVLSGTLHFPTPDHPARHLAVAHQGRVRGVTSTLRRGNRDTHDWLLFLPEDAPPPGELSWYEVRGTDGAWTLHPLDVSDTVPPPIQER